ncbi:MAG: UDP-glucose--hexose-1-phosphate uridylyltransferase [Defluviitaleaceae bacterium]|nr:UDP-glucose--hexose-1-phosphate uridylyltransferase [Defluviitaleaceae bacterium]
MSIEPLLKYAENEGLISGLDIILARNLLLDLLDIKNPADSDFDTTKSLSNILAPIFEYAGCKTITECDLLEGRIMGILTPRQQEVTTKFYSLLQKQGDALDYFYKLSCATNYIKTERIKKNLAWKHNTDFGELEITINLSKPEKDPKEIAQAITQKDVSYPKCLLCIENVGYAGHINHPARQNHRIIPIDLCGEDWYLQYSPYAYYTEHCIPLCGEHRPISINKTTFEKLLAFLELFPHYFVGSNADLPIVGGSILNHDHFQGGRYNFPIEKAKSIKSYTLMGIKAEILKWPMSAIRLKSKNSKHIINASTAILEKWRGYSDESVGIFAHSGNTPHNTITPIARINADGEYEFDLVLRNNRTSEEYPDGIFHPHPHVHHIKKENIGLIEVMGLAILPGRLAQEVEKAPDEQKNYMGEVFLEVLTHAGVFKCTKAEAFMKFMTACGAKLEETSWT